MSPYSWIRERLILEIFWLLAMKRFTRNSRNSCIWISIIFLTIWWKVIGISIINILFIGIFNVSLVIIYSIFSIFLWIWSSVILFSVKPWSIELSSCQYTQIKFSLTFWTLFIMFISIFSLFISYNFLFFFYFSFSVILFLYNFGYFYENRENMCTFPLLPNEEF